MLVSWLAGPRKTTSGAAKTWKPLLVWARQPKGRPKRTLNRTAGTQSASLCTCMYVGGVVVRFSVLLVPLRVSTNPSHTPWLGYICHHISFVAFSRPSQPPVRCPGHAPWHIPAFFHAFCTCGWGWWGWLVAHHTITKAVKARNHATARPARLVSLKARRGPRYHATCPHRPPRSEKLCEMSL